MINNVVNYKWEIRNSTFYKSNYSDSGIKSIVPLASHVGACTRSGCREGNAPMMPRSLQDPHAAHFVCMGGLARLTNGLAAAQQSRNSLVQYISAANQSSIHHTNRHAQTNTRTHRQTDDDIIAICFVRHIIWRRPITWQSPSAAPSLSTEAAIQCFISIHPRQLSPGCLDRRA